MQQLIFPLILLALFGLLYVAFLKLSSKILGFTFVNWRHSVIFSFLMVFLVMLGRATTSFTGIYLPFGISVVCSLVLHLCLGGFFFKNRLANQQGNLLGWREGIQLSAITYGLFCLTFGALWLSLNFVVPFS